MIIPPDLFLVARYFILPIQVDRITKHIPGAKVLHPFFSRTAHS
jgi:hypothetical protein